MLPNAGTTLSLEEALELVDMAINVGHEGRTTRDAKRKAERLGKKQKYKNHFKAATMDELSVLNFAAKHRHVLLAKLLMAHLAVDPNTTQYDKRDRITLHYAALGGHLELVTLLMTTYNSDVNARDKCGSTPLHLAVFNDNHDAAVEMIRRGANVLRQNHFGMAMHAAAFCGSLPVVTTLNEQYPNQINAAISEFVTPFVCAIYGGEADCQDYLKQRVSLDGKALMYKVVSSKTEETEAVELVETLLEREADPNLCDEILHEDAAIICAAKKGWPDVVSLLLERTNRIPGVDWTAAGIIDHVTTDDFKQRDTVRINARVSHLKSKVLEELNDENCLTAFVVCMALKPDMNSVEWDH